jgi:hypothetical protein
VHAATSRNKIRGKNMIIKKGEKPRGKKNVFRGLVKI